MLHATMGFSRLMSHVQQLEESKIGSILGQGTSQEKLRRIFQGIVVLKLGISPGLIMDFPTKRNQVSPRIAMIGIPSP